MESKMLRVVGLAAAVPFVPEDVLDARNRRISIIVMNRKAERAITQEGAAIEVGSAEEMTQKMAPPAPAPPVVPKVPDFRPALVLPPPPGAAATGQR